MDNAPTYEDAVQAFEDADQKYKDLFDKFASGEVISELFAMCQGDVTKMRYEYEGAWQMLHDLLDERNLKWREAADALRAQVVLAPLKERGPEGKPTLLTVGPFKVSSVTGRSFNADEAVKLLERFGVLEPALALTRVDSKGKTVPVLKQEWTLDGFNEFLAWAKARHLEAVVDGSYQEVEKTPQVKGPKMLAFLGDAKDK